MNKNQIAKKYSRALINTVEVQDIPKVIEELIVFSKLIEANRKLKLLFASQIFSEEEQNRALKELLTHLKISLQSEKLLKLIIIQKHLFAIKEIIKASMNVYNDMLKKTTAVVISPVTMDPSYMDRLKNVLKTLTKRDISIENRIDPSLLGGFIIKIGSTVYDSSLKGQLRLLSAELTKEI